MISAGRPCPPHVSIVLLDHCGLLYFLQSTRKTLCVSTFGHPRVVVDGTEHVDLPLVHPLQCEHPLLDLSASRFTLLEFGKSQSWASPSCRNEQSHKRQIQAAGGMRRVSVWGSSCPYIDVLSPLLQPFNKLQDDSMCDSTARIK